MQLQVRGVASTPTRADTYSMDDTSNNDGYALELLDEAAELSKSGDRFADEVYTKVKEAAVSVARNLTPTEQLALVDALRARGHSQKMAKSAVEHLVETVGEVCDIKTPCVHCRSEDTEEVESHTEDVEHLFECMSCERLFIPEGTPPTNFPALLMRTREGVEVVGTLDSFSLHYPPAFGSDYCEDGSDCINAMFTPDEPSWDCVWAELAGKVEPEMLTLYPYTPEPYGVGPTLQEL